ncbi:ABC transporter substrate-binding protein [Streptomyces sp. PA03-1a]|nr:ABC transporter substrate-binding protein [Streptomyces sp. PA03-1a]MDX2817427.1 ABC transporter substrate-binding protein [Streptomyces sp. PA03-5A]
MTTYVLTGPDGQPYRSAVPGTLGGHRRGRLYGRLDCPAALRAIARGGYVRERVFFADEATAVAAGHRPCARCLPGRYRQWKATPRERNAMIYPDAPAAAPASPLVTPEGIAVLDGVPAPRPHTGSELTALLGLLGDARPRPRAVAVGHSRDAASRTAAGAFAAAWRASGGTVVTVVDWPERAASWLRAAGRLTAPAPDAWVVAAAPAGWAQLARRLRHSTPWDPARTYGFASLGDARVVAAAGAETLQGLRGAAADGGTWRVDRGWVTAAAPGTGGAR